MKRLKVTITLFSALLLCIPVQSSTVPVLDGLIIEHMMNTDGKYPTLVHPDNTDLMPTIRLMYEQYGTSILAPEHPVSYAQFEELVTKRRDEMIAWEHSQYFNTRFLRKSDKVTTAMLADGFEEVLFTTPDKVTISGLYLRRPNARASVIVSAGFVPGRREGMATLFKVLPPDCNILFIDARSHGKSGGGKLWWNITRYGMSEYLDIIGAVEFLHQKSAIPIILYGTCAGAYHAARAAVALRDENRLGTLNIKGLIFDSGWDVPARAGLMWLKSFGKAGKALYYPAAATYSCIKKVIYNRREKHLRLSDMIGRLPNTLPIHFIHAEQDTRAPLADIKTLINKAPYKQVSILTLSGHSDGFLKEKYLYRQLLSDYFDTALSSSSTH